MNDEWTKSTQNSIVRDIHEKFGDNLGLFLFWEINLLRRIAYLPTWEIGYDRLRETLAWWLWTKSELGCNRKTITRIRKDVYRLLVYWLVLVAYVEYSSRRISSHNDRSALHTSFFPPMAPLDFLSGFTYVHCSAYVCCRPTV